MSESKDISDAKRWLRYAREDLVAAESISANRRLAPRHACWFAQQSAERAIKSIYVFLQVDYPCVHDLEVLRSALPGDWKVKTEPSRLTGLTLWAIEARYAGRWKEPSEPDAAEAVAQARIILRVAFEDLANRGVAFNSPESS